MKKVLLTGMTSNQCKANRTSNTFYSGSRALYEVLSKMEGVEFQHGNPQDYDFAEFDTVFVGLYAMNSLGSASRSGNVCEQLLKATKSHTHVILHYDDWHVHSFRTGVNAMLKEKNPRRLYSMFFKDRNIDSMVQAVMEWASRIRSGELKYDFLLPMMGWASHKVNTVGGTMGIPGAFFIPYDYCGAFSVMDNLPVQTKERGWVLATKYDYSEYVNSKNFKWPVIRYGCKKNGDNYLPTEEDMVRAAYTKYWGLISHPYPAKLRGQGRDKFMLASWTNSIIISEPGEADNVPEYAVQPADIEQMSDQELQSLADSQKKAYTRESWSYEKVAQLVRDLI